MVLIVEELGEEIVDREGFARFIAEIVAPLFVAMHGDSLAIACHHEINFKDALAKLVIK